MRLHLLVFFWDGGRSCRQSKIMVVEKFPPEISPTTQGPNATRRGDSTREHHGRTPDGENKESILSVPFAEATPKSHGKRLGAAAPDSPPRSLLAQPAPTNPVLAPCPCPRLPPTPPSNPVLVAPLQMPADVGLLIFSCDALKWTNSLHLACPRVFVFLCVDQVTFAPLWRVTCAGSGACAPTHTCRAEI